jgi:hypothetical protein
MFYCLIINKYLECTIIFRKKKVQLFCQNIQIYFFELNITQIFIKNRVLVYKIDV